jgi:hypothetical protein
MMSQMPSKIIPKFFGSLSFFIFLASFFASHLNYAGIDHHRQYSHLTVMDQEGQTIRAGRVPNVQAEIEKFLEAVGAVEAVIETGRSS